MAPTDIPGPRRYRQPVDPFDWAARNPKKLVGWLAIAVVVGWFFFVGRFFFICSRCVLCPAYFSDDFRTVPKASHIDCPDCFSISIHYGNIDSASIYQYR